MSTTASHDQLVRTMHRDRPTVPVTPGAPWHGVPACTEHAEVFQHPLLEDAEASSPQERAQARGLRARAEQVCGECPLLEACLYRAVVEQDVAGYVGGTTEAERRTMRRQLGITVQRDDLSAWTGTRGPNRRLTTDEVLRLRAAHPTESLPELAVRLGCSLSTIKRHLRAHRDGTAISTDTAPEPPDMDAVLSAWHRVRRGVRPHLAA